MDTAREMRDEPENRVCLRGRLTAEPELRELPSGDALVTFRVSVPRGGRRGSDWVDCAAWSGRVRGSAMRWHKGDLVAVEGALRRRFFRIAGAGRAQTRLELEVLAGRRLTRSAPA